MSDPNALPAFRPARSLAAAGGRPRGGWRFYDWRASRQTVAGRVRELAAAHPGRLALFGPGVALTYGALDSAANRIANALLAARGPRPEAVLLLQDTGPLAVTAALGVARAGKHFVAVEPSFPAPRVREIAADALAAVTLTDSEHLAQAGECRDDGSTVIAIDDMDAGDDRAPEIAVAPDAIALLNYTSGSTGRPKGVVQTHRSAIAQAYRFGNAFELGDEDRLASFGSLAWSGSVWDAFGALCMGSCLGVYDIRRYGVHHLAAWLEREAISVFSGMAIARLLIAHCADLRLPGVRLVSLGGDTVFRHDVLAFQRLFPDAVMAVGLGTTEGGRIAEQYIAPGTVPAERVVPVGYPTPGVALELVGDDEAEVATGETGEIVASSDELAAGYWNLPDVTAERFRDDPADPTRRRYFTGDLGRRLPDGMLQHVGRKDFAIKIRGYAVDAGEVEARLLCLEGVREACVVARPTGDGGADQLVAFVVRTEGAPATATLRQALLDALPGHMVPRRFVDVEALPRTPNGKPDRNALPPVRDSHRDLATPCVAPRSALEAEIAAIWSDVLDVEPIGVDDDFLALGSDSLHATRIASQLFARFGLDVDLATLFNERTVARMAALAASREAARHGRVSAPPIGRGRR